MTNRTEVILETADALYGAITMGVIMALFPEVKPSRLRHLIHDLVSRGALVGAWAGGTGQRVWLTTRNAAGRVAGLRKWLADPVAVRSALAAKNAGTIQPPVTFAHAQLAGEIVAGLGIHGRKFDSELHAEGGALVADGEAWPTPSRRLLIEVERMVRQGPRRWRRAGGLVEKIVSQFGYDDGEGVPVQHLIAAPKFGSGHGGAADFEWELDRLIKQKVAGWADITPDSGWWFLPLERVESDPVWHPILPGTEDPPFLPGIAARRTTFANLRAKNSAIDRDRKMRAASVKAGVALPAGVAILPAAASDPTTP